VHVRYGGLSPSYRTRTRPSGHRPSNSSCFEITLRHATLGRTPLDEFSARRRELYLTPHNIHDRQTSMHPAVFETALPASERPQTHTFDCASIEIDLINFAFLYFLLFLSFPLEPLCMSVPQFPGWCAGQLHRKL